MVRARVALGIALLAGVGGCSPELGDTPFSCGESNTCPEGYACQATVCVREGVTPKSARPMRVTWINAAEMYWFPSAEGGAVLLVNDGFTPGSRGLYEIVVDTKGVPSSPRLLAKYGEEFPTASSVGLLPDGRYAVATLRFPTAASDTIDLALSAIEREAATDKTPATETLFTEQEPYLGGAEPSYISAAVSGEAVDVAWTRPSGGGSVVVAHVEHQGSVWKATRTATTSLPDGVLPLSGDCLLWKHGDGSLTLRVGFESFAVARVGTDGTVSPFASLDDVPLYAFDDQLLLLRYGDEDPATSTYPVQIALTDADGNDLGVDDAGFVGDATEPHTAVPYEDGAIFAPLSRDRAASSLEVGFRSPKAGLSTIAKIARDSTDPLYSARPFVNGDKVYVAWTSFHGSLMDLWVAAAPIAKAPLAATHAAAEDARPMRVWSLPVGAARPAVVSSRLGRTR